MQPLAADRYPSLRICSYTCALRIKRDHRRDLLVWGKPLYSLEDRANGNLLEMGARPVRLGSGLALPWKQ